MDAMSSTCNPESNFFSPQGRYNAAASAGVWDKETPYKSFRKNNRLESKKRASRKYLSKSSIERFSSVKISLTSGSEQ
jgi:hypothetical protein